MHQKIRCLFKNSKGQIQLLLILVIIGVAILLSGGLSVKKNIRTQQGGNVENIPLIPTLPAQETFTSTGSCCDTGEGAACQLVDSDCFNFNGSDYCRIKSNVTLAESVGWIDNAPGSHNGKPIYLNISEVAGECTPGDGSQDQLWSGSQCVGIANDAAIYVCNEDCPEITKQKLTTGLELPIGQKGNGVYDVYFKKTEPIPDFIRFCPKSFSFNSLAPKEQKSFRDLFNQLLNQGGNTPKITPTPTIVQNASPNPSRTPKKSLQLEQVEFESKKTVEEVKKQLEKTLATWFSPYCKPAIYLYPKEKTDVNVQIAPKGKLTLTIPKYPTTTGWQVTAYPNGRIDHQNSTYEYLYYEAEIPDSNISEPKEGFVVDYKNLENFLSDLLPRLGLNKKEAKEFKDYWLAALPRFPYYYIGVVPKSTLDQIAPLTINPSPNNVIRVTLYFKALDNKINVQPPKINTPKRSGFTVVEWGGIFKTDKNHPFSCLM